MTKLLETPAALPPLTPQHTSDNGHSDSVIKNPASLLGLLYLLTAIASGLGLLGKIALVKRLVPLPSPMLLLLVVAGMLLPLAAPYALRFRYVLAPLVAVILVATFSIIFPKVQQMHSIGRGTDQPDCVIVAANGMMAGQWPYQRDKLWSHNPMSCGPGWVALQAPIVKSAGYPTNLVAVWSISLLTIFLAAGWDTTASLLTLLGLSPGLWLTAANGTDFLSFGIAVAALTAAASRVQKKKLLFILAVGLVAQFRLPTLLLPVFFTRQIGRFAAILSTVFALGCQVAFLYWNAGSFIADGPLHILFKLTNAHLLSTDRSLAAVEITLPILCAALVVSYLETLLKLRYSLLLYLSALFFLPAILDLARKVQLYRTPLKTLAFWEGSMWISACLPLVALAFVLSRDPGVHETIGQREPRPELA